MLFIIIPRESFSNGDRKPLIKANEEYLPQYV